MKADDKNMEFQILEAAEKLFVEQGFSKTSTGQIAKLAGCNQALVHYYYRTKDNLFEKVFEEKIRLMAGNLLSINSTGISFEEKIVKVVETHFDFLKQNPRLVSFVFNEISVNPDRLQSLTDRLQQYPKSISAQLSDDVQKWVEQGIIRPISGMDLFLTIVSLNVTPFLMRPVVQKLLNLSDKDIDSMLEQRKKEIVETVLSRLRK